MDKLVKTLFKFDDIFKEIGLDYFIHGSTLLGVVRDGKIYNRIIFDKEHNFGCLAEDLTPGMIRSLQDVFPYFFSHGTKLPYSLNYLAFEKPNKDVWELENGFGLLAAFYKTRTKRIENMNMDLCKWWPLGYIGDKKKWGTVEIEGRKFYTPSDYDFWFSHYFGHDWRIEKVGWHWSRDANNIVSLHELERSGEIPT